ncbi:hypothetical protein [Paenibacillus woosongensis]|uniref:Uncharacterized protein n=1 Tax=Paenibacillus woosongensis TaxID=307580 RepID=A0ABQ4MYY1_9BACL|nr:hypothetical protein [Paenibacillus woosongensis]GIP61137.1 hypothetical protein J15TS10_49510 [Paenibacillus woosongensis]
MLGIVVLVGALLWALHKFSKSTRLITWIKNAILIFLAFMVLINLEDAYHFIVRETVLWWPLVKQNASDISNNMREFFSSLKGGK